MKYVVTCFRYNFIIRSLKVIWDTALIDVLFPAFLNYSSQMVGYLCYGWRFPAEVVWLLKRNMWWCRKITVIELLGMLALARLLSRSSRIWEVKFVNKAVWHLVDVCAMFSLCRKNANEKWRCTLLWKEALCRYLCAEFISWMKIHKSFAVSALLRTRSAFQVS